MPQIREQIAMVHLPPSKTLKYLFHVRKTKINHPQGWLYFCCGPRDSRFMSRRGKSLQVHQKPPLRGGFSFRHGSFGPAHLQRNGQRKKDRGSGAIIPEGFSRRLKES